MSNVRIAQKDGNYHVWLMGDLNISTVDQVKDTIAEILENKPGIVVINFNDVEYLDSSSIATLVSLVKEARSNNMDLIFYELKPDIQNIIDVSGLDRYFKIITKDEFEEEYKKNVL